MSYDVYSSQSIRKSLSLEHSLHHNLKSPRARPRSQLQSVVKIKPNMALSFRNVAPSHAVKISKEELLVSVHGCSRNHVPTRDPGPETAPSTSHSFPACKVGALLPPILQLRKTHLREVKEFADLAGKW